MSMTSPSGQARLEASTDEIGAFLDRTFDLVPVGREFAHTDFGGGIAALLSEA